MLLRSGNSTNHTATLFLKDPPTTSRANSLTFFKTNWSHFMSTTPAEVANRYVVASPFSALRQAIKSDADYAWSWHCNVAMSFVDEGVSHETANRGAARFMYSAFDVNTALFGHFTNMEKHWKQTAMKTTETPPAVKVKNALCCELASLPPAFQNAVALSVIEITEDFWNIETKLVDRALCETDETLRQFIPYIVLHNPVDHTYFTYSRGQGSAEARLRGNLSVGLGGHMDELVPDGCTFKSWCLAEGQRELEEEAGITAMLLTDGFDGLLCDPTNPVGRVHVGLLAVVSVNPNIISTLEADVIEHGEWLTLTQLDAAAARLEGWSLATVAYLHTVEGT